MADKVQQTAGNVMAGSARNIQVYGSYHLTAEAAAEKQEQLLEHFSSFVDSASERGHRAVCVALDGTDELSDLGRNIERRAFETLADNLPAEKLRTEYERYEDRSLFLMGIDLHERRVVAASRLIVGAGGLGPSTKAIRDAVEHPAYRTGLSDSPQLPPGDLSAATEWLLHGGSIGTLGHHTMPVSRRSLEESAGILPGSTVLDVSSLARVPDLGRREAGVTWTPLLAGGLYRLSVHLRVEKLVAFLTTDLLQAIRQLCGSPWRDLGDLDPVHYVPGDTFTSQPAYLDIQEFRETLTRRHESGTRRPVPETKLFHYAMDPAAADAFALW